MAHKFDTVGLVGDKWMCSDACICEDLKLTVGDMNATDLIISPSTIYGNFSEEELAPYERTNLINQRGKNKLEFLANTDPKYNQFLTYDTFQDCLSEHVNGDAAVNATHDLTDMFQLSSQFSHSEADQQKIYDYLELEFLGWAEKKFRCSGMCNRSLFYYTRDMIENPPDQECLAIIYDHVVDIIQPPKNMIVILALICFWNFLLHFFLYHKREAKDKSQNKQTEMQQNRQEVYREQ